MSCSSCQMERVVSWCGNIETVICHSRPMPSSRVQWDHSRLTSQKLADLSVLQDLWLGNGRVRIINAAQGLSHVTPLTLLCATLTNTLADMAAGMCAHCYIQTHSVHYLSRVGPVKWTKLWARPHCWCASVRDTQLMARGNQNCGRPRLCIFG